MANKSKLYYQKKDGSVIQITGRPYWQRRLEARSWWPAYLQWRKARAVERFLSSQAEVNLVVTRDNQIVQAEAAGA